jgi:hypothetical protein
MRTQPGTRMTKANVWPLIGAAALLVLIVVPAALATGGSSSGPQATGSGVKQKLKKVTGQVTQLQGQVKELQGQVAVLQGEQGGARPPSGAAGGDLTGNFPNPEIGPNAVGTGELQGDSVTEPKIAAGAVGTSELLDDSVTAPKIAADAVGTSELLGDSVTEPKIAADAVTGPKIFDRAVDTPELQFDSVEEDQLADGAVGSGALIDIMRFQSTISVPPMGGVGEDSQNCPSGEVISGGAQFAFPSGDISASYPRGGSWFAEGQNNGTVAQDLTVYVLCLPSEP